MERRRRRAAWLVVLATAAVLIAGDQCRAEEVDSALPMSDQRERLERLLGDRDVTAPPPGIDAALWKSIVPPGNEMTAARVALGRRLYFEPRLSADGTVACATCHDVSRGFADNRPVAEGIDHQRGRRNAPTTMNVLLLQTFLLDGRAPSLEAQASLPIVNPVEMGQPTPAAAVAAIAADASYQQQFRDAYGRPPSFADICRALAAFERTLVFLDAPFDGFAAGRQDAISASARRGWALFNGKGRCVACHNLNLARTLGTDDRFHNIGVAARHRDFQSLAQAAVRELGRENGGVAAVDQLAVATDLSELGRFLVTKDPADIGAFKTSPLRNVGLTAPYMHDGSMHTMWDVMDHYNKGGEANPYLDGGIEPLGLSEPEINELVEFMFTLTDARFAAENERAYAEQRALAAQQRPFRDQRMAMASRGTGSDQSAPANAPH